MLDAYFEATIKAYNKIGIKNFRDSKFEINFTKKAIGIICKIMIFPIIFCVDYVKLHQDNCLLTSVIRKRIIQICSHMMMLHLTYINV